MFNDNITKASDIKMLYSVGRNIPKLASGMKVMYSSQLCCNLSEHRNLGAYSEFLYYGGYVEEDRVVGQGYDDNMNVTNQGTTESQYVRVKGFMDYELKLFAGGDDSMLRNDYYTDRKLKVENLNIVSQYNVGNYLNDWSSEHRTTIFEAYNDYANYQDNWSAQFYNESLAYQNLLLRNNY